MSHRSVIVTLVGPDRSGIVADLARVIASHGGNWERSELARLADQFAGILEITVPDDAIEPLRRSLNDLCGDAMTVLLQLAGDTEREPRLHRTLRITATDRRGIVEQVTTALAQAAANVETMESAIEETPHAGGRVFRARLEVSATDERTIDALGDRLEGIAPDVIVDVEA